MARTQARQPLGCRAAIAARSACGASGTMNSTPPKIVVTWCPAVVAAANTTAAAKSASRPAVIQRKTYGSPFRKMPSEKMVGNWPNRCTVSDIADDSTSAIAA